MKKIFIADDSPVVRKRLVDLIGEIGGVTVEGQADNAPEMLEAIRRVKPDVVVMDVRMLGSKGVEVLQGIKKTLHDIIVVMMSNSTEQSYREKYLEAGAEFFLDKSMEFDKLQKILG